MEYILAIIFFGGVIYFGFIKPKQTKKKQSMTDIISNDPVIKQIDEEIAKLNNRSGQLSSEAERIFKIHGSKEERKSWIEEEKIIKINKIDKYLKLGYIDNEEKEKYVNEFIDNKSKTFSEYYTYAFRDFDTEASLWKELLTKLDDLLENDKKRFNLSKKFDKVTAQRLVNGEVWLNMTARELIESRGYPKDKEKELTKDGEIEIFIYGNKNTGSYFTLQNEKVIKLKDKG